MKKVLSLVLAVVMVLGMTTVALAQVPGATVTGATYPSRPSIGDTEGAATTTGTDVTITDGTTPWTSDNAFPGGAWESATFTIENYAWDGATSGTYADGDTPVLTFDAVLAGGTPDTFAAGSGTVPGFVATSEIATATYTVSAGTSTASFTITYKTLDETKPTVTDVTPKNTGVATSTSSVVITFSESMDTSTEGTVALSGGAGSLGTTFAWSDSDTKLTVTTMSGLANSTEYTLTISGFKDVAGNEMDSDSSNKFTTVAPNGTFSGTPGSKTGAALTGITTAGSTGVTYSYTLESPAAPGINGALASATANNGVTVTSAVINAGKVNLTFDVPALTAGSHPITFTLTDNTPGTARVLTLTVPMTVTSAPTLTVPSNLRIKSINQDYSFDGRFFTSTDFSTVNDLSFLTGNDEVYAPILAGYFIWETSSKEEVNIANYNGTDYRNAFLTSTQLDKVKVSMTSQKKVKDVFEKTDLVMKDKKSVLRLSVHEFLNTTKDIEGSVDIGLTAGGKTHTRASIDFTAGNIEEEVDEGQEEAYSIGNIYLKATATVRGLAIEAHENLIFTRNMSNNSKIYANVTTDLSSADEELILKYSELDSVYTVIQTGLASAGTTAEFIDLGETFHVYNENLEYIGTTADKKLPYSNKYYLTTKKIDFGTDVGEEPGTEPTPTEPTAPTPTDPQVPGTGGDGGSTSPSTNYNPNTGL